MSDLPRVAVGAIQRAADTKPMLWALVALLKRAGRQLQIFHDQARFTAGDGGRVICGQNSRYLDSWLMSAELCRESFAYGAGGCDFAIVHGRYESSLSDFELGGRLDPLCDWLDLPKLAVIDVAAVANCQLPPRPDGAAGLLLDRVPRGMVAHWRTLLESLWGIPVLGSLGELPSLRQRVAVPVEGDCPCTICDELGRELAETARLERLMDVAVGHPLPVCDSSIFSSGGRLDGLRVAVAYDDALDCYFPDVLDLLELHGASVQAFSPLRDDGLPPGADVVYLGCGHPEKHAAALAANDCMKVALRSHVCQGRRLYAEAGGLAYLCQNLRFASGEMLPMTGVLPATAVFEPAESRAVEVSFARDHWLGAAGESLRGYTGAAWRIEPARDLENSDLEDGDLQNMAAEPAQRNLMVGHRNALGSGLHINFAAQPQFLRRFSPAGEHSYC